MSKRIAFVDMIMTESELNSLAGKKRVEVNKTILNALQEFYKVILYYNIGSRKTCNKIIEDSNNLGLYRAIITNIIQHLPTPEELKLLEFTCRNMKNEAENYARRIHGNSLDNIKLLHENFSETKIVIYTCLPCPVLSDDLLIDCGASLIIRRELETYKYKSDLINDAKKNLERILTWTK